MSKQANPKTIGAFVIGAIGLLITALLVLGSGRLFSDTDRYVAYFPGSVKGLRVGANVDFRGATIGQVVDIRLDYDVPNSAFFIPVIIEIDHDRVLVLGGEENSDDDDIGLLIDAGLRAQLGMESLVTGLLFVDLDLRPNTPVNLSGIDNLYPEIPTVPNTFEQIENTVQAITQKLPDAFDDFNEILGDLRGSFGDSSGDLKKIFTDIGIITARLTEAGPIFTDTMQNADVALAEFRALAETLNAMAQENRDQIAGSVAAVERMADQVNNAIAENREGMRDFTQTGLYEITGLAQDAQRMVNQINRLAEELERDPARFLLGDRSGGVSAEE